MASKTVPSSTTCHQPKTTGAGDPGHPKNSPCETAKNKLRKNLGRFACFSPFNSFRISKQSSELSKLCAQLRPIYAPQTFWNQQAIGAFAAGTLSLLNSLIPLLLFHFFNPSLLHPFTHALCRAAPSSRSSVFGSARRFRYIWHAAFLGANAI